MGKGGKIILVLMESLSGSNHRFAAVRPKIADKLEQIRWDPWVQHHVLYREKKKIRTLRSS